MQLKLAERRMAAWASAAVVLACAGAARGNLQFILTQSGTISADALAGFNAAAARWTANFTGNATVRITIATSASLPAGVLASTGSTSSTVAYTTYRNALAGTSTSADDATAISNLPASSVPLYLNYTSDNPNGSGSATPYLDNNSSTNNTTLSVNRSVLRAVGLYNATGSDASLTFSSTFPFDYNPNDGITSGQYDFVGIVTHEIGHALGFTSNVDVLDVNAANGSFQSSDGTLPKPEDLFRFSTASVANGARDFTADARAKFFSLDAGATSIATYSTGVNKGDGRQASHWKDGTSPNSGIMDPTAAPNELLSISENDRRFFDVIGWTRDNTWEWLYATGGNINQPLNWNADGVLSASQDAVFELGATYSANVTVTTLSVATIGAVTNFTARDLIDRKDTLTIVPENASRSITVARNLIVGDTAGSTASLSITAGVLNSPTTMIGTAAGSTGTFSFSGATWTNTGTVYVGGTTGAAAGTAVLNIAATTQAQLQGGLRVYGAGTANVSTGLTTIAGLTVDAGGKFAAAGPGTVNFTGAVVNNGTVSFAGGQASLGTVTGTGSLAVSGTSVLTAARVVQGGVAMTGGTLTVSPFGGNASVSVIGSAAISGTGFLDLKDNDLIVTTTSESSVRSAIASWFNAGARNGKGLGTSIPAAAAVGSAASYTTLGVITNSDGEGGLIYSSFDGASGLTASSVLVKYTYLGDTDLNGLVDGSDLANLLAGMNGHLTGWVNGDVDLNGVVNSTDLGYLMSALAHQGAPLNGPTGGTGGAVPEPGAALGASGLAIAALRRRRR